MRDLALVAFVGALFLLALKRPFLFVLVYIYVDTVSPQRISYFLLNRVPISMIVAALAIGGWLLLDKKELRFAPRQGLILILLAYVTWTTANADVPVEAWAKWDWVWKGLLFTIFLPFTLRTKLRIEAALLFLTLSAAAIVIVGGIKTVLSGGGYGVLNLMVDNNSGLYESSTISTIAIGLIPIIIWFTRFGTVFPPDRRVKLFAAGLIFACLLIPIGTEARTGLVCMALLGLLMLRDAKRRLLYIAGAALLGLAAIPFLPTSFTSRMDTIQGFKADESAGTRLAVWAWTWDYVQHHPFGGGFEAYRQNRIQVQTVNVQTAGETQMVTAQTTADEGRAYHSAYFEMLGEQGFPGLALFLLFHGIGLVRMEIVRRRYLRAEGDKAWIAPLATALQQFQLVYLVGALFVGIAYQPFVYLMLATQIGFDSWLGGRERRARRAGNGFAIANPAPPERSEAPSL
jgi:probable O-glycosylation ligase (exosortase A-associated)